MDISKEELLLEEKKLEETVKEIDNQLNNAGTELFTEDKDLKAFQKMMWEQKREFDNAEWNEFIKENEFKINLLEDKARKFRRLQKVKGSPYFGSIIFNKESIYIGITGIRRDMDYLVYDWRAPISSLFYDYELGRAQYEAPGGIETGEITRKRQYKIENSRLIHVFDTNVNIDDDILQEVLAETSSEKMKNIVTTIQKEQNAIIRDDKTANIIVQGIAGSGKTSVALHRIAFLLYRLEYLTSGNVLIFAPNNVFAEYISEVLPDLGEDNTLQSTYHEFVSSFISEYYRVEPYSSFVERFYKGTRQDNDLITFKLSDKIIGAIETYAKYYTQAARFTADLVYHDTTIAMDEINTLLFERYNNKPLFERLDLIAEKINNSYFKGRKKDLISIRSQLLKIANFTTDYKKIYREFFETAIFKDYYPYMYRKNENLRGLSGKVMNYEDATIFVYLKFLLSGYPYQVAMREVIIDEAQDYTYLQYKILHKIFKNAHFTILGDVNQTVNPFYRYDKLDILLNIFTENSRYIELNKTYRSSPEIIAYANSILGLNHVSAIRKTANVPVIKRPLKDLQHIGKDIAYLKKKYKSVAVITKSIEEARLIGESLKKNYSKTSIIDINTTSFHKELVVAPAYGVKGLEFDSAIIVNNFSDDAYLYYVAVTRSQHELIVYE